MRKILLVLGMIGALGIALVALRSQPEPHARGREPAAKELPSAHAPVKSESSETQALADLKAQLKEKDALIASLLLARVQEARAGTLGTRAERPDPRMEAMRVLDERMEQGSANSSDARQLHEVIGAALARGILTSTATTDLQCGGRLCRLTISDESQGKVERDTEKLSDSVEKVVGGMIALDGEEGEKIIYLARSSSDLRVSPDTPPGQQPTQGASDRQAL